MKITPITKDNLSYFQDFITVEDARFIHDGRKILPIGLVADNLMEKVNCAAGAICIRPDNFILDISSFYVSPAYRGRGAGKFLLDETKRIFAEQDTEFSIEFLLHGREEEKLAKFLEHYGFSYADPEFDVYEIMVNDIKNTKLIGRKGEGEPFSAIPRMVFNLSQAEASKNGAMLPAGGLKSEKIDMDVSVGILNKTNHAIESYAVFEKISDMALLLSALFSKDNNPTTLLHMLETSARLIMEKYPLKTKIMIQPVTEAGRMLVARIYKDAKVVSCRYRYIV